jgi:ribosomal-protein-alanine N-acetyltransferase
VRLRAATDRDVPAVHALEVLAFGADAWSQESVREELTSPTRRAVVACDPDVVGYAVTSTPGDPLDPVDLQRIAVRPELRRRGVARDLLAAVDPGGRMLLEVAAGNAAALAFYAAEGFTEISRRRRYYRDGSDAVVMERPAPR